MHSHFNGEPTESDEVWYMFKFDAEENQNWWLLNLVYLGLWYSSNYHYISMQPTLWGHTWDFKKHIKGRKAGKKDLRK